MDCIGSNSSQWEIQKHASRGFKNGCLAAIIGFWKSCEVNNWKCLQLVRSGCLQNCILRTVTDYRRLPFSSLRAIVPLAGGTLSRWCSLTISLFRSGDMPVMPFTISPSSLYAGQLCAQESATRCLRPGAADKKRRTPCTSQSLCWKSTRRHFY